MNYKKEIILTKKQGDYISVKTATYNYWGDFNEHKNEFVIIRPFHTNDPRDFHDSITGILIHLKDIVEVE